MADEQPLSAEASALKNEGNELLKRGDVRGAVARYTDALALAPDSAVLYSNRSAALARSGDVQGALADAEKCVTLAPRWGKAYSRLAVALKDANRGEESAAATEQGLALEPDNAQLKAMKHRLITSTVCDALRGPWNGTVSEEVGGYVQEFDFWSESDVKVIVLGTTVDAKYALDVSADPHPHLDLSVPTAEGSPIVRHIYRLEGDVLHLCSPYMAPPDERPTSFAGPGYVKMVRGERKVSAEELAKRERIKKLSAAERLAAFLREVTAAVPSVDTRPTQLDTEVTMAGKMAANVKFQAAYQALTEQYGADVELAVKELVVGVRALADQPDGVQRAVAEFRDKMMFAGLIPRPGEVEQMEAAQREQQLAEGGERVRELDEEPEAQRPREEAEGGAPLNGGGAAVASAATAASKPQTPVKPAATAASGGWQTALVVVGLGLAAAAAAAYLLSRKSETGASASASAASARPAPGAVVHATASAPAARSVVAARKA